MRADARRVTREYDRSILIVERCGKTLESASHCAFRASPFLYREKVESLRARASPARFAPCRKERPHRPTVGILAFHEAPATIKTRDDRLARATMVIYSGQVYRLSCDPIRTGYRVPGSAYRIPTVARIYTRAPSDMDCSTCKGGS